MQISWLSLVGEWDISPLVTGGLVPASLLYIPALHLMARFLANGRLMDENTGWGRVCALAQ